MWEKKTEQQLLTPVHHKAINDKLMTCKLLQCRTYHHETEINRKIIIIIIIIIMIISFFAFIFTHSPSSHAGRTGTGLLASTASVHTSCN